MNKANRETKVKVKQVVFDLNKPHKGQGYYWSDYYQNKSPSQTFIKSFREPGSGIFVVIDFPSGVFRNSLRGPMTKLYIYLGLLRGT